MRVLRWLLALLVALIACAILAVLFIWNDRPDLDASGVPLARSAGHDPSDGRVRATWLGVTTLLFDDGETQILTDGFFSRPGPLAVLGDRPIAPDLAGIDAALAATGIDRLAAVVPAHSHYDHALDTAEVARRTGALVIGSSSTLNLMLGAGLAPDRGVDLTDGGSIALGRFELTLIRSRHMPVDDAGTPPFPGTIDAPLVPPAPVSAWKEGASYSILIAHPRGTALVQGSAGFVPGALANEHADVVFLGIGGLGRLGADYTRDYWREIVSTTGATRVLPVHWDDFTRPWGDVLPFPRRFDDTGASLAFLLTLAREGQVSLERPVFGEAIALF